MKKIFSLGGMLAVALLLGASCNINVQNTTPTPEKTNSNDINTIVEKTKQNTNTAPSLPAENTTETPSDSIAYTNPDFGFTITLPATWEGYVTEKSENDLGGTSYSFGFENWKNIFIISVYPTEVNPHPNMNYFGTDGQVYYYGSQAQSIQTEDLQARWDEVSQIMKTFDVANLSDGLEDWLTYTNDTYHFQIKYPTTYETTTDNYGWANAVVLFKDKDPQAQSYSASISVWDDINDYKADNSYSAMSYQYYKVGEKYVVISYMGLDADTKAIWERALDTFKKTN